MKAEAERSPEQRFRDS